MEIRGRYLALLMFFMLLLAVLALRLTVIQILEKEKYAAIAEKQSVTVLSGLSSRGSIYDRNGKTVTEMTESFLFLIEKRKSDRELSELLESIQARRVNRVNERYHIYSIPVRNREAEEILCGKYGALMLKTRERYSENQAAVHVIGYLNERDATGACGIEKDFEELLSKSRKVYYGKADGQGYLIGGLGLRVDGEDMNYGVVTTLDLPLQLAAEEALAEAGVSGAVIITDPASGEILAAASSPVFNPWQVAEYLGSDGKEFLNKAAGCQYPPGSVFKIVVAAAALEGGRITPETEFVCKGYHEVNGVRVKCSTGGEEGHGAITFARAFAVSCNSVFVQAGEMLGGEAILDAARKFGLGREAVEGISGQEKGNLPSTEDVLGAGIGNLSIGQGKLMVTPMQAARITGIIAAGGVDHGLTLIRGTMNGALGYQMAPKPKKVRVISEGTAEAIRRMMTETVAEGTADNLVLPVSVSAAGKTGSAEAAVQDASLVHSWFTGFVPASSPRYAVTIFVENGGSGRKSAVPIFSSLLMKIPLD